MFRKLSRLKFNFSRISDKIAAEAKIKELFGQTKESDKETKMAIEKGIVKKAREMAQNNIKIRNYHFYEYKRGEDFIQNIPTNRDFAYTPKDLLAQEQHKDRATIQDLSPIVNHESRAKIYRQKIGAYHEKQKKYEIEEFQRYLDQYPGTSKGPRPEDDIQAFQRYAKKKIPRILQDEIAHEKFRKQEIAESAGTRKGEQAKEEEIRDQPQITAPVTLIDFFGIDREVYDPKTISVQQRQNFCNAIQEAYMDEPILDEYKIEVPVIPATTFFNYQHFVRHWMNWNNFRNSYTQYNFKKIQIEMNQSMQKITKTLCSQQNGEWVDLPANIPSLYRYYKCLPKQLQEHPGMKDIYLGLQYSSPDFTYQEKEDAINSTCLWLLPFDQVSTKILKDYTQRSRVYATPYIHEKIQTISPEFTWDLDEFFDELKKQELRGETSNQNKDLKYPQPPEVHKMWEEGAPNLPVDYYENDDGFWDGIISEKLKRYDQFKPMLKTRRHFTH